MHFNVLWVVGKVTKISCVIKLKAYQTKLRPKTFLISNFFKIKKIILLFGSKGLQTRGVTSRSYDIDNFDLDQS